MINGRARNCPGIYGDASQSGLNFERFLKPGFYLVGERGEIPVQVTTVFDDRGFKAVDLFEFDSVAIQMPQNCAPTRGAEVDG